MEKLLSNVRVITLEVGMAAPSASMVLGDLGAEVIKVEPPEGDSLRTLEDGLSRGRALSREHFYFLAHNRSKKSLILDLGTPLGKQAFLDLIRVSDVFLSNFRPAAIARLGANHESLKKINPKIISCNMSGFGSSGPYKDRPCYDTEGYAWSGMLSICGEPGRRPVKPGPPIGDLAAGLHAIIGILAALNKRYQTGEGSLVEVSVVNTCVALMATFFAKYFVTGEVPGPLGARHLALAPSGFYRTRDGYVTASSSWPRIARVIGAEWMIEDPRFKTLPARLKNREELDKILEEHLMQANTEQWVELFAAEDIPGAPLNTVDKAALDPQINHNNMILTLKNPAGGEVKVVGNPIKVPGVEEEYQPPPALGQHNQEILSGLLGYSQEKIRMLEEEQRSHAQELAEHLHKKR